MPETSDTVWIETPALGLRSCLTAWLEAAGVSWLCSRNAGCDVVPHSGAQFIYAYAEWYGRSLTRGLRARACTPENGSGRPAGNRVQGLRLGSAVRSRRRSNLRCGVWSRYKAMRRLHSPKCWAEGH